MEHIERNLDNIKRYLEDNMAILQPMSFYRMPNMLLVSTIQPTWLNQTICSIVKQATDKNLKVEITSVGSARLVIYSP